jgi:N-formylglutamate amidohydrolase
VIIHIPHSSTVVPPNVREQFFVDDATIRAEIRRSTDTFTDELFDASGCDKLVFPIPRIVVDPERFESDDLEPMARVGRGVIYTSQTSGEAMRRALTPVEREDLLRSYYRPHHQRLTQLTESELDREGHALIVDAHSFPDAPWAVELNKKGERPDFCLGVDEFHTPPELTKTAEKLLKKHGYSVAINTPYSGTIIPLKYLNKNKRVNGIMIEINRKVYMDEVSGDKSANFETTAKAVWDLLEAIKGV